jgi:hypothetical protein
MQDEIQKDTGTRLLMQETNELQLDPNAIVPVYIASKLIHAGKFLALRDANPWLYFTSRWLSIASSSAELNRQPRHWIEDNKADIRRACAVLVYFEPTDKLKGGVHEVGFADAYEKEILIIGHHPDYPEHFFGKNMIRVATLSDAIIRLKEKARFAEAS